jgi:exodeoxyribonuclease-3
VRIATWNVNSIRVRQTHVRRWLERVRPDIVVLQEIKCEAHAFPAAVFADLGYKSEVVGQKAYNGVAALSHRDIVIQHRKLPGLPAEDAQARYIEVETEGLTVIGIYLPNGRRPRHHHSRGFQRLPCSAGLFSGRLASDRCAAAARDAGAVPPAGS